LSAPALLTEATKTMKSFLIWRIILGWEAGEEVALEGH